MAATVSHTKNYFVGPQDGWVEIVDATSTNLVFLRTSGVPHTHPYYIFSGTSAPSLVAGDATGTVTFSTGLPTLGQTVTIGTEVYTFVTTRSAPFQVALGAAFANTATNFTNAVNSDSALVTASNASSTVTVKSIAKGSQGNYALSTNATNVAVSGAALTGGTDPDIGVLVCHHPFKAANYSNNNASKFWVRTTNPVPNSQKADGRLRIDVYADGGALQ